MSGDIHVGDVCVITHSTLDGYPVGTEVTVLMVLPANEQEIPGNCYVIDIVSSHTLVVGNRRCLRKKEPPAKREETGDWALCPWRPGVPDHA